MAPNLVPTLEQLARYVRQRAGDDRPLDQLASAVEVQLHLNELSERLVGNFVEKAHSQGKSWADIGEVMGVTRQAAHHRYQNRWVHFERFSDEAKECMDRAADEAQRFNHNYLGTEHILLGLIASRSSIAGKALKGLGVSLGHVRREVEKRIGVGSRRTSLPPVALTPRGRAVLDLALKNAIAFGYRRVYSGNLAVALVELGAGVAHDILEELKVDLKKIDPAIERLMPDRRDEEGGEEAFGFGEKWNLDDYLKEISALPKLTDSELRNELESARKGDRKASKSVVQALLAETANVALRVRPAEMNPLEAVQEANLVLLRLVQDPKVVDVTRVLAGRIRRHLGKKPLSG